jgi:general secretion pathway protein M
MIASLDAKQQRQFAIGILALAVVIFLSVTAGPVWYANASRQAALDQAQERLLRYEQIAARDEELLPQYEALRQAQKSAGNQLRSDTAAVAGAELQRRVKDITAVHQAQIVSTQILPVASEEGFVRIALRVRLRGVLPSLLRSIYDIETNNVHMFLDNLSLRNNAASLRQQQQHIRPMEAEFDLIAYMPEES